MASERCLFLRRIWLSVHKNVLVFRRSLYWELPLIFVPAIIGMTVLSSVYVQLADDLPTEKGGVTFTTLKGVLDENTVHSVTTLNDTEEGSGVAEFTHLNNDDYSDSAMKSNFAVSEQRARNGEILNRTFLTERFNATRDTTLISHEEIVHYKRKSQRLYQVGPAKMRSYERPPIDLHLDLTRSFHTKNYTTLPVIKEAILAPVSGFGIARWTEMYTGVVLIALLPVVVLGCHGVSSESDSGLQEWMLSMGAEALDFYLSHGLLCFLRNIAVLFILFIPNLLYFFDTPYLFSTFFANIMLALSASMFSLLCSTFSRSRTTSTLWCLLIWVLLFLISFKTPKVDSPSLWIYFCALSPLASFKCFFESIRVYHIRGCDETSIFSLVYPDVFTRFESLSYMFAVFALTLIYLFLFEIYAPDCIVFSEKQLDRVPAPESEGIEMEQEDAWMDRAVIFDKVYKKWEKMTESAVSNASFIAYYGQVTVLLGHDGSGKSTMMQLITGDTEATSGWIFALNLIKGRAHRFRGKSVAYCPQRMPLFGKLTVRDHLRLFYCLKTRDNDWNVDVMSMAAVVGLEDSLDKKPSSLDETSKRLLALATTLVGDTRIILLDEPFEGLDLEGREAYRRVLDSQKENRCILIATSSSDTAEMVADRIIALSGGRVLAAGSLSFLKSTFGFTYVLDVLFAEDVSDKRRPAERLKKASNHKFNAHVVNNLYYRS
ncbi:hypothetical protein Q1695_011502 [Nippostrongylus brasiliensis]|nr:hypothetical protein Q1695_011502 [Nippostrongylus brasiliensis]